MTEEAIINEIKQQINESAVLIYMKGSPKLPQCGFSAQAVQILELCGVPFNFVDVIANPDVRQFLPKVAGWPTFPQLYVEGELIGGCDIMRELYQQGELQKLLQKFIRD